MLQASRPPLERILRIDSAIRQGTGPNAKALGKIVEASRRTVMRDLEFLKDRLHAPLEYDSSKNGYFYSDTAWKLPYFQLTEGEIVALFLSEQVLKHIGNHPFADELRTVLSKLASKLPDQVTVDLGRLSEHYSVRPSPVSLIQSSDIFRRLHQAVRQSRQIEIRYWTASTKKERTRTVDPYHIHLIDGDWFLIGFCHHREAVLMFAVDRIRELTETDKTAFVPNDFDIHTYMANSLRRMRGTSKPFVVKLRFLPSAAKYVREKCIHTSQKLETFLDGSLILSVKVNHLLEVKRFALAHGGDCEVLAPKRLRDDIRAEAERILKNITNSDKE